ncbi:MAG: HmuY family protein [Cytophagales bacterium]|nr:HmuY family protein [Cytophagales bacterium]
MKTRFVYIFLMLSFIFAFSSCDDDDDVQPFSVNFSASEAGVSGTALQTEVTITFSRPSDVDGTLNLTVNTAGLTYGEDQDFFTTPAMTANQLSLPFSSGDQSVTFVVHAGTALNRDEDQNITFSLNQITGGGFTLGNNDEITVLFSDDFTAPSGTAQLDAGGENFTQVAFFDLSRAKQTNVATHSWDLGFYNENGEFRVVLNSAAFTMAQSIDKTDLATVTPTDTAGFGAAMVVGFSSSNTAIPWVDNPDGDLTKTAFGDISATDSENPVFIVKRDGNRNWKKVRVLQNGNNYTLQYADIASTTFETAEISKDDNFNFSFFDLDSGPAMVEPAKEEWDFRYGTYTEHASFGQPAIPYGFKDYIIINRSNVEVSMVMIADIEYNAFSVSDVTSLTFSSEINVIGSSWRLGGGQNTPPELFNDRYYVVRDTEDNVYKVRFTSLMDPVKGRGFPDFAFELVQE